METTKLSSKGQVVLPSAIRNAKKWKPGTTLMIQETADGVLLTPVKPWPVTLVENVFGSAGYTGPAKTIEDMNRGIEAAMRERWERKKK